MLKESVLFIVSTGALIYFISPSNEADKTEPPRQEAQESRKTAVASSDHGWGDDGTEEDYESFTFGEPVSDPDDGDDGPVQDEDDNTGRRTDRSDAGGTATPDFSSSRDDSSDGPVSGEKGSVNNPIIFETSNPPDPDDD